MPSVEYMAGFFDGEGCVNFTVAGKNSQLALRVYLVNTNEEFLKVVQEQYGGNLYRGRSGKSTWKPFRMLVWHSRHAIDFLYAIEPYVQIKKAQIQLVRKWWDWMQTDGRLEGFRRPNGGGSHRRTAATKTREIEFKAMMNVLNQKGTGNAIF